MLKTLAMYLPQFHRIPENDKWWGEGFTEWTAVKGAGKLYEAHNQPRVPLNKNYYNLLEHDTMAWQAELMKKYHVDGMCIYHYWFANGRRILEKPAENLLQWEDIDMPFCFCWANETWSRTWKKLSDGNVWSSMYEPKEPGKESGILLKQSYGREIDWEEHFQYLIPFFKDKRYIKLDGKPVFVIYKPSKIYSLWSMKNYFNKLAKDNGLSGIYIIGMEKNRDLGLDAICIRQPYYAMAESSKEDGVISLRSLVTYSYDKLWAAIQEQKASVNQTYLCGFVDYDDSPRRGKDGGVVQGASPEKFYKNFKELYKKSLMLGNEFIFVNAWNEWGEGMYLEPDEENEYAYLEFLAKAIIECRGNINKKVEAEAGGEIEETIEKSKMAEQIRNRHDKLLDNWMHLRDIDIKFSAYFKKYGYHKIGIYGAGKLGTHLFYELKKENVEVIFGIDKNSKNVVFPIKVYAPDQKMPKVDAIVITIIDKYGEISKMLCEKNACPMIPLEDIVQELIWEADS